MLWQRNSKVKTKQLLLRHMLNAVWKKETNTLGDCDILPQNIQKQKQFIPSYNLAFKWHPE